MSSWSKDPSQAEIDHLYKFLVLPHFIYGLPAWSFWTWYQYQGLFFRNWPMRVKWAPFLPAGTWQAPWKSNLDKEGPPIEIINKLTFFDKLGCLAPNPKKLSALVFETLTFYMGRTRRMTCRHFGTFWATEKASARITAESRMFVWWNNDSNEEEKGNWDSKRL